MTEERTGRLFILVGPGGVGKNALMKEILKQTDDLQQLPTATTREARSGEQDGREHQFVSVKHFEEMIRNNELVEHQEVHPGKYYGVPKQTVDDAILEKRDLIADIEVKGAAILVDSYPQNIVSVFVIPPSVETLVERLRGRGASHRDIGDRINRFPMEMLYAPLSNYVIVNDDVTDALKELQTIVRAARYGEPYSGSNAVSYRTALTFKDKDVYYCPPDAENCAYVSGFEKGIDAVLIAQRTVKEVLGKEPRSENLHYRNVVGAPPVTIDYSAAEHTCCLTYHYVYELENEDTIPSDWKRITADAIELEVNRL